MDDPLTLGIFFLQQSVIFSLRLPNYIIENLLFEGKIGEEYVNKETYQKICDRYKEAIEEANKALTLIIGFAIIAFYTYLILPPTESFKVPLIDLSVSRQLWISVIPCISYVLQIFIFTSILWVLALHLTLKKLIKKSNEYKKKLENMTQENVDLERISSLKIVEKDKIIPDMTKFYLKGIVGQFWLILTIGDFINSRTGKFKRINYIWYVPSLFLILSIIMSPLAIGLYFIIQLFLTGTLWLGLIYSILFIPCSILLIPLITILFVLALFGRVAGSVGSLGR